MSARVSPAAPVKFFLEADPTVRAERRHRELWPPGRGPSSRRAPSWPGGIIETGPDRGAAGGG